MMEVYLFYFAPSKAWSWNANSSENEMFLRAPELQAGNEHKQQRPLAQNAVQQNEKNRNLQKFAVLTGGRARDSWRTERSIIGDHQGARQKSFEGLKVDLLLFLKGGSFAISAKALLFLTPFLDKRLVWSTLQKLILIPKIFCRISFDAIS